MAEQIGFAAQTPAQKPFRVRLELSEPNEKDNLWEVVAVVTVLDKDGEGIEDKKVLFILGNSKWEEETDSDGIARHTFRLGSGTHTIIARVGSESKKKPVSIKEDKKKKKPANISVRKVPKMGEKGTSTVFIHILTENDTPVRDVNVRMLNHFHPGGFVDLPPTNARGETSCEVSVSEIANHNTVRFVVVGSNLEAQITLYRETE